MADPNTPGWAQQAPSWASQPASGGAPAWAQPQAPPAVPRAPGKTGIFDQIGQTYQDLTDPSHPDHDPNALESTLIGVTYSKPIQSVQANYQQAVNTGLAMEPVRGAMEALGIGRQQDESNDSLHARYNQAVIQARQSAQQQMQDNTVGAYDGDPVHIAERFGQQALNTGAGLAANPEYFLAPGAGGPGASFLGGVAKAGVVNAGIGGASDLAAQAMDKVAGVKKDFDVQQNLMSTLSSGVFGAALHGANEGAPIVSDYVKSLFANRGMDTTPVTNPTGSNIQPMTGDHVQMSPEDHVQYQQLLQTGSVDDIKNFLQGRQGPQPSYQDVNNWVNHRDSTTASDPMQDTHLQPDLSYKDQQRQAVEDHVNAQIANWSNAPNVEVVHGPEDIADPQQRTEAMRNDAPGGEAPGAPGFYGSDGVTRMYSGRIGTPEQTNALLYHEGLGHFGLTQKFGDKLDTVLQSMLDRNVNQFSRDTDAWQQKNPGAYGGDRLRAAEEVLAERSEGGQLPKSWSDALTHTMKQFGRKMGLNLAYSDGEVNHILAMAHDTIVNGKPDARANGFQGSSKFMRHNALGEEQVDHEHLDDVDRLKANPRYWSDPEYRANVNELARTRFPVEDGDKGRDIAQPKYANEAEARAATGSKFMFTDPHDDETHTVYHGSPYQNIDEFRTENIRNRTGTPGTISFSTDPEHAKIYGKYIHEVRVSGKFGDYLNPEHGKMVFDWRHNSSGMKDTYKRIHDHYVNDSDRAQTHIKFAQDNLRTDIENGQYSQWENTKLWKDLGWDGVFTKEGGARNLIVGDSANLSKSSVGKFMRAFQIEPKDVAQEAYDRLDEDYEPKVRSWDDAIQAANNTALDVNKLKSVRSVGNLDQHLFQYNAAAKELNDKLVTAAQKVAGGEALTAEEHADQLQNIAQFHYVLGRIENDAGQVGRALNAMKAVDFSRHNLLNLQQSLKDSGSTLSGLSDPDTMDKFLRQYQVLGNTKGGQILLRDLSKPGWEKYALTLYRNMLLSGLGTHVKAPMDMSTGIALDLEDRLGAIPIGKMHDALQALGITKQGGMHGREAVGYIFGLTKAITDGDAWTKAMSAIKDPHSQTRRMSREAPAVLPRLAGQLTTLPTRLIAAQDAFFRAISTNAHLYGEGVSKSLAEGGDLNWSDHLTRGVSYGQNPTDEMRSTAIARADKALLLSENPLTNFMERGKQIVGRQTPDFLDRAVTSIIDLFTPIIRVPANSLLSRVIARSPLGMLDPETRSMMSAGGRQADIAISRMLVGTMKLAMYWSAAGVAGNYLTGNDRKQKEASGWRPNSVQEGNTYHTGNELAASINPVDVHNSTATMVADIHDAYKDGANQGNTGIALKLASARLMKDMYSQLWTGDIAKATGMFSDSPTDTGAATRTLGGIASSTAVPAVVAQGRAFTDPYQRDTSVPGSISGSIMNQIQNRIPGLSNNLPARYSVYGDPLKTGQNIIGTHNWLTGGNSVPQTDDPTELELNRLSADKSIVSPVTRTIPTGTYDDDGKAITRKLSTPEFEEYQQKAGQYIVDDVRQEMSTSRWDALPDKYKIALVKSIVSTQKARARRELFSQ